jgi:hypothetical protein
MARRARRSSSILLDFARSWRMAASKRPINFLRTCEPHGSGVLPALVSESGLRVAAMSHVLLKEGKQSKFTLNFVLFAVTLWLILGEDWLRIKTVRPLAVAVI